MGSGRTRATGPEEDVAFQLVYGDHQLALPLYFDDHVEARLLTLIQQRRDETTAQDPKLASIAKDISEAIAALIANTTLPPTDKQIRYAISIARELSLELPAQVLQFRPSMVAFLGTHAARYRRLKGQ
jgi:hypothetical protein